MGQGQFAIGGTRRLAQHHFRQVRHQAVPEQAVFLHREAVPLRQGQNKVIRVEGFHERMVSDVSN